LRKLGVDVVLTSAAQFAVATAGFIDSCFSGDVSHPDQPILTSEIEEAERRKLPKGDHVWDDRASAITALKSVSLAHWAVLEFAEEDTPAARPVATPPDEVDKFVGGSPHLDVLDAAF
jgi:hypothetical protein